MSIFSYSDSLGDTFFAEPSLALQFDRDRNFTKLKSTEDLMQEYARYSVTHPDLWQSSQLARFKRRNHLRIALKDVLRLSTLGETMIELSTLADVILKNALAYCDQELEKRYGRPQFRDQEGRIARSGFSVVSLGKLGGIELNYSSEIDLLFIYAHDGETSGGSESSSIITNKEYFVRLAEAVTRTTTQETPQGEVFHVDLSRRPEAEKGALAISLNSALEYYGHRAREWELQMLIKARHSAGDPRLTREFVHGAQLYLYLSSMNRESIKAELAEQENISKQRDERRDGVLHMKFSEGGIRDIELLTQYLQRLHGGQDSWLRSGGTFIALRKLNDKGRISDADFARLSSAYEFFRKVEHRIQLEAGPSSHWLPAAHGTLNRLARRVGIEVEIPGDAGSALLAQLKQTFSLVREICKRLIYPRTAPPLAVAFDLKVPVTGVSDPAMDHYESTLRLLHTHSPESARLAREVPLGARARKDADRFLAALLGSSESLGQAQEHPERVRRALELIAASPFLGAMITEYPEDLAIVDSMQAVHSSSSTTKFSITLKSTADESLDSGEARDLDSIASYEAAAFPWVMEGGLNFKEKMALLRTEYRRQLLALGARDCAVLGSVYVSLRRWSRLAMRIVASAVLIAAEALGLKLGRGNFPMVVLGLGSLGLNQFDIASVAELVFVAPAGSNKNVIAHAALLANKTIDILSSYTCDGNLFAVITRHRPGGTNGGLVMTEDVFQDYVAKTVPFEQVIGCVNACFVAGNNGANREIAAQLPTSLYERFASWPDPEDYLRSHFSVRDSGTAKAASTAGAPSDGLSGIDFALAVLRLRHRISLSAGLNPTEQIAALHIEKLIGEADASLLIEGAIFLRTVDHAVRLVTGAAMDGLPENLANFEAIDALVRHWGLLQDADSLALCLREKREQVGSVCRRLLGLG